MRNTRLWRWAAATAAAAALLLGVAAAPALASGSGYTLINYPGTSVCRHHSITVGVWAQPDTSRANRKYFIDVWGPTGAHSFHSQGWAPESPRGWGLWHVEAWKLGTYLVVYGTWHNGRETKTKYPVRSHTC